MAGILPGFIRKFKMPLPGGWGGDGGEDGCVGEVTGGGGRPPDGVSGSSSMETVLVHAVGG